MPFTRGELDELVALGEKGIGEIVALQREYASMPLSPR
jgi:hypothetical protein